jgi:hypothetical protein
MDAETFLGAILIATWAAVVLRGLEEIARNTNMEEVPRMAGTLGDPSERGFLQWDTYGGARDRPTQGLPTR